MAKADTEPGAASKENVECGHRLHQDSRVAEVHPRHHRRELDPAGAGGQERQHRVAFRFVGLRAAHDRMLPEMVRHADAVEVCLLDGPRHLGQGVGEAVRITRPVEAVELKSKLHETIPPSLAAVMPLR